MTAPFFAFNDKKYTKVADFGLDMLMPYSKFVALPSDGTPFAPPRAVFADVDGTCTLTDAFGNVIANFPLKKGENRIMPIAIASLSTTLHVIGAV